MKSLQSQPAEFKVTRMTISDMYRMPFLHISLLFTLGDRAEDVKLMPEMVLFVAVIIIRVPKVRNLFASSHYVESHIPQYHRVGEMVGPVHIQFRLTDEKRTNILGDF